MGRELKEANKKFKVYWKKDLKLLKKEFGKKQVAMFKLMCYAFYLRGWTDRGAR